MNDGVARGARLVLGFVCLVSIGGVGCGGAAERRPKAASPQIAKISPSAVKTQIDGGSPGERNLLRLILAGMGPTGINTALIEDPDAIWNPYPAGAVVLKLDSGPLDPDPRASWEEYLVAGAFLDRSEAEGFPPVLALESTNGASRIGPRRPGAGVPRPPPAHAGSEQAALETFRSAATRSGATVRELRVLEPYGIALAIKLEARNPARFLQDRLRGFLQDLGVPSLAPRYDGFAIELVDEDGERAMMVTEASRAGSFSQWIRPALAGCDPLPTHPGPCCPEPPPPCPGD